MIKNQDNIVVILPRGGNIIFSSTLTLKAIERFLGPGWCLKSIGFMPDDTDRVKYRERVPRNVKDCLSPPCPACPSPDDEN